MTRSSSAELPRTAKPSSSSLRRISGSPTAFQGKAARTDGPVRYTAPSLVFERDGARQEAGGFQPVEAYDVVIANLDPALERQAPAEDPIEVLRAFPFALTTAEVSARLDAAQIAWARMNTVEDYVNHPQLSARECWREIGSPAGRLRAGGAMRRSRR